MTVIDADALWAELGELPELLGVWPDEQAAWLVDAAILDDDASGDASIWPTLAGLDPSDRARRLRAGLRALGASRLADLDRDSWQPLGLGALVHELFGRGETVAAGSLVRSDTDGPLPLTLVRLVRVGRHVVALLHEIDTRAGLHRLLVTRPDALPTQLAASAVSGQDVEVTGAPRTVALAALPDTLERLGPPLRSSRLELLTRQQDDRPDAQLVSVTAIHGGPTWLAVPVPDEGGRPTQARLTPLTDAAAASAIAQLVRDWIGQI
jgi:hypothetical protein